jgi:tRNA1(Val) A37 N6-methylase TrmN6
MDTTIDGLLNRRVTLEQPANGYRVAVDTVLLAAAVPAVAGDKLLELGCGVGGTMLCLAARVPDVTVIGIEIDEELAQLCTANIARNNFQDRLSVLRGDVLELFENKILQQDRSNPLPLVGGIRAVLPASFDHVLMNPPYHEEARHDVSADAQKRTANAEKSGDLARWIANAARALTSNGMLTMIHRADREAEIIDLLRMDFGAVEILPIAPKADAAPKRIILRARKDAVSFPPLRRENFVLHQADGRYTEAAEDILRHMKALAFAP